MMTVQSRAQEIRKHYRLTEPSDIERIMEGENLRVVRFPFPGRVQEVTVGNWVAIQSSLKDVRRVHELLAHALGHHLLHAGNQPFFHFHHDRATSMQWERQAWNFAYELLMPFKLVERMLRICSSDEELRDEFQVTDEFCEMRLKEFERARKEKRIEDKSSRARK
jgi:Zn-dependent peptidase ImmA (M78 family)